VIGYQDSRKQSSKRAWRERETPRGYFTGRYPYIKERRNKQRLAVSEMIQDEIPPTKPVLKLVFWVPATRLSMIQDEIRLRRLTSTEFAAPRSNEAHDTGRDSPSTLTGLTLASSQQFRGGCHD